MKGFDYCCIVSLISKNEAFKLMQNADLTEKSGTLYKNGKKQLQNLVILKLKKITKKISPI